ARAAHDRRARLTLRAEGPRRARAAHAVVRRRARHLARAPSDDRARHARGPVVVAPGHALASVVIRPLRDARALVAARRVGARVDGLAPAGPVRGEPVGARLAGRVIGPGAPDRVAACDGRAARARLAVVVLALRAPADV